MTQIPSGQPEPEQYRYPGQPYAGWPPPTPPKKKRRIGLWIVLALAVLTFGGCMAALATAANKESSTGAKQVTTRTASTDPATVEATTAAPTPSGYTPRPADFTLSVKVLDKQCFGSAGCNVSYRVDFANISSQVPDDGSFEVTYEVRGGETTSVGTIEVQGGKYDPQEDFTSTTSSAKKLVAVVTSVESL